LDVLRGWRTVFNCPVFVRAADAEALDRIAMASAVTDHGLNTVTQQAIEKRERKMALGVMLLSALLMFSIASFLPVETRDPTILRGPFLHQNGHAYVGHLFIFGLKADEQGNWNQSTLQLYEDDKPLGPQHISSDYIANEGRGLYLFWRDNNGMAIVFSSTDNSDPNTNGRTYRGVDPQAKDPYEKNLRIR
jgi:hypothetical protein